MTILFIPEYKKKAKQILFRKLQIARSSVDTQPNRYKVKAHNEADIYFDQFKKSMVSEEMNNSALFVKRINCK
uniref:Uncharacterized protein n=1 Tax=Caenorhabditis japonica TaxID=281687 RepID=A0A8R1DN53_CAEJA